MEFLAIVLILLAVIAAEKYVYQKYAFSRLEYHCRFSAAEVFEGDEIITVASLVAAGLGVSLVPKIPGMDHLDIKFLAVNAPKCSREIGLAWYANRPMSLAAHRFQNFIINKFSKK